MGGLHRMKVGETQMMLRKRAGSADLESEHPD
jgi:hypothetical protein